jgi:hypothetical protein
MAGVAIHICIKMPVCTRRWLWGTRAVITVTLKAVWIILLVYFPMVKYSAFEGVSGVTECAIQGGCHVTLRLTGGAITMAA